MATPVAADADADDLPVALPLEAVADRPQRGPFSMLFVVMLAAFVSTAVYIFGKNYLFAQ
jgi:hypothetical protein